ncbi:hypothetical protein QWZ06_21530 [Chryseobacterium tructae]|uniref:Uncharacterized protein n=1 Tax=Chryseobacterium tructae TaxID=1037380 RepID=A0ABV7Y2I2_9FLAO|nr:hypothetical protein [Chryseobacterium tructae]MDN3694664.1 hypothetical protein [Chryseobacterium tructae]
MERTWNRVHYFIYKFEVKATYLFRYILNFIFSPITKIKFLKKGLERRGSSFKDIDDVALDLSNNPSYGKSIAFAGVHIGGLIILIEYGLFNVLQIILGKSLIQFVWEPGNSYKWIFIIGMLAMPWFINEKLLFKNGKYLKYFDEFDKESKEVKRKWAWISFSIILGIVIFFILSFVLLG